ncbi:hypothetical protein IC232_13845 [Microvirga sp. BT688]|uniref:hypothetical protein n=1 Tax=Microvirga sp. TaxID=1873136 RepID=UPI001684633B|nr:hypothetical protein [Microvirga sp.]MBD2747782.1 hypothetical protein [Microvirga sp.]
MARYTSPKLDGHKVAFRGRRFWIIEVEEGRDFDWISKGMGDVAIYDTADQLTIGSASRKEGGGFICTVMCGPHAFQYDVPRVEDLGRVADAELNRLSKAMG